MSKELRGLMVEIMGSDCTNNGVTSEKEHILLLCEDGPFKIKEGDSYLTLMKGWGGRALMAVSVIDGIPKAGMFGGHFIYSSDSRFTKFSGQPIHVHDRFEG